MSETPKEHPYSSIDVIKVTNFIQGQTSLYASYPNKPSLFNPIVLSDGTKIKVHYFRGDYSEADIDTKEPCVHFDELAVYAEQMLAEIGQLIMVSGQGESTLAVKIVVEKKSPDLSEVSEKIEDVRDNLENV